MQKSNTSKKRKEKKRKEKKRDEQTNNQKIKQFSKMKLHRKMEKCHLLSLVPVFPAKSHLIQTALFIMRVRLFNHHTLIQKVNKKREIIMNNRWLSVNCFESNVDIFS